MHRRYRNIFGKDIKKSCEAEGKDELPVPTRMRKADFMKLTKPDDSLLADFTRPYRDS